VLLPQSTIMTDFVHRHCSLFSDASLDLPTYKKYRVTQFTVIFIMVISNLLRILPKLSNSQRKRVNLDI